jgi:amidase
MCGLLDRLSRREVSAQELHQAARQRARVANERLNAVTVWVDDLPGAGAAPDAPLAGIPTVVKDNEDLTGYPTSQGSAAVPDVPALACSPFVRRLLETGLVPLAKTTLPEFGLTASTESTRFGATANPWDTSRSAGGSSGGSAALVAAGVVPVGHANDGGGSIRIPAACCGLVGLKPSRGRLPDRPELERLPVPITRQGVLTRSVRDTARFYVEAERLHRDPRLPQIGLVTGPPRRRLRVALMLSTIADLPVDAETAAAVSAAAQLCERLGHHVEPVEPPVPSSFGPDFLHYWELLAFALQHGGRRLYGPGFDPGRTEALTRGLAAMAVRSSALMVGSLRRLRRLARERETVFPRYDVVLSPVLGHEAPPLGYLGPHVEVRTHLVRLLRFTAFTPVQNVSGSPAVSLPLGRSRAGLPIGVHLSAPYGHERRLLELALELEEAAPWPLLSTAP